MQWLNNGDKMNEEKLFEHLNFLAESDEKHALLGAYVKQCEEGIKQAKAHSFLQVEGTVAEREAKSIDGDLYNQAVIEHINAYKQFKILDNRRNTAVLNINVFQTLSANRRKGSL